MEGISPECRQGNESGGACRCGKWEKVLYSYVGMRFGTREFAFSGNRQGSRNGGIG